VLAEPLLDARVFAFLEQIFGLVALAPRVGERERAILAVAVRADGVGFLALSNGSRCPESQALRKPTSYL
jgi:hypothetical protein